MASRQVIFRRFRTIVAVTLAAVLAWYVVNRVLSTGRAIQLCTNAAAEMARSAGPVTTLRIAAYNIAHGRGTGSSNWGGGSTRQQRERLAAIARFLKGQRLDVVVLNEVDFDTVWSGHVNQAEAIAVAAGFPRWVEQRNVDAAIPFCSWRFGNAVLSRYPIRSARLIELPAYSAWESVLAGQKQGLVCEIELSERRRFRLFAVHLEHRSEAVRVQSAQCIVQLRRQSPLPLVCAGDFNSSPLDFPHAEPDATGNTAISLLAAGGYTLPLPAFSKGHSTFSTRDPQRVIDWILAPAPWRIESYVVPRVDWSDHRPVIATISIGDIGEFDPR